MKKYLPVILALLFFSCEKEVIIEPGSGEELLVAEGHIEPSLPPYVILTRNVSVNDKINTSKINELFVRDAEIKVHNGQDTAVLEEFRSDQLPGPLLAIISAEIGVKLASQNDPDGLVAVIYTSPAIFGETGQGYHLDIKAEGHHLTSYTTIPQPNPLDSVWSVPHHDKEHLSRLYGRYSDPEGEDNYARYFTRTEREPFFPPYFSSVLDDKSLLNVSGKTIDVPLDRGYIRYGNPQFGEYGYFESGDTVTVRWCAIDYDHWRFWSTSEFDFNSQGNPFSAPTVTESNINGGLGVWGGYSPSYHTVVIP